ncbi:flagellar motor switch protein FliN [Pseudomonas sp. TH35]|uniref:flagellar motor switch protein FliN n=2 Tax=Pseudomonadota TaxID=1224 RepID=UPI001913F047|nr:MULTISPECIES: flagellar motor switch protein FliN [unclassified Pseudomonas]MBK5299915.1 flagellar motor switch protein FliN [Bacillus sp. TH86]MBK5319684.1 flagellar motor switch protein FliN [Bacillus sp. TH59]MBK5334634.1 flagellar motor switch protein FliN [Bacillus sp. TH57]MBK5308723.1 flagellar motor switch protein FliN [Pseudomonas sp. TH71]MBK5367927.1 flagellar motor switch protein FliN [Pseudomonas sp. TH40]
MMNDDMNAQDDQALADEWAAALEETGDAGQDDIDALLAADASGLSSNRLPMEEFGSVPKSNDPVTLDGPNLDVILDIPVSISMEVGSTDINIRNLLQLNQGSVIELDRLAGEPLDVLVNGTLIAHGEVVVVNEKFGIRLTDVISPSERIKKLR